MVHNACVKRENPFDTDPKTGLAHSDRFAHTRMLAGNDDAFKGLNPFLVTFFDSHVNADGISRSKAGNIGSHLTVLDTLHCLVHRPRSSVSLNISSTSRCSRSLSDRLRIRSGRRLSVFSIAFRLLQRSISP